MSQFVAVVTAFALLLLGAAASAQGQVTVTRLTGCAGSPVFYFAIGVFNLLSEVL